MDRLKSIPDRDSFRRSGRDKAYTIKRRLIYFNPCKGLALRLRIIAHLKSVDVFNS
jgi:hypothetical protein